ncbi:hypothetical protein G6F37_000726 [Rhizopus arrhizus]|nr:hypothetical protein G6F38_000890 [Rhizopus arrhizus]KAG1163974.1 hypothetical protein G6F37_000726 [Rhizopus arrhizus]
MEKHEKIIKSLDEAFERVDASFENDELRVFGKNTTGIFQELDVIRRKQIDLASDHVSLEAIHDIPPIKMDQDSEDYFIKNFEKKKEMLKNMMNKLDDLTQTMEQFKKISKPNT